MFAYYYLHTESKDLIHKPVSVVESDPNYFNSSFVQKVWKIDTEDRFDAWQLCIEASVLGANKKRIAKLVKQWGLTDIDAPHFLERAGLVCKQDGDEWCVTDATFVNLQEDQAGFGDTIFEALVDFAEQGSLTR